MQGGFTGVDVFFVISGFLITGIIIGAVDRGDFSFLQFYGRRIRRIFPALLLVMAVTLLAGWVVLLAYEYEQVGKHVAGGAGFVSNFVFWREAGYFDKSAETKPLLHLWSLGVEEQFYIVWPFLIWAVLKARASLLGFAVIVGVLSFWINVTDVGTDAAMTFYLPQTRFWELLAGCTLAFAARAFARQANPSVGGQSAALLAKAGRALTLAARAAALRNLAAWLGALLITLALFEVTRARPFPGWWAALPVCGAFLLIAAGPSAWFNRVILSNRVLVWVGLISFPIYLWHWPLLSFARIVESDTPSLALRVAAVFLAILLSWLTYVLIERPVRFGRHGRAKAIVLFVLMIAIGGAGYWIFLERGMVDRDIAKRTQQLTDWTRDWTYEATTMKDGHIEGLKILRGRVNEGGSVCRRQPDWSVLRPRGLSL